MATTLQIITDKSVYISTRRLLDFDFIMQMVHRHLKDKSDASTFHDLYSRAAEWKSQDDVVKPFGDRRGTTLNVCSFDLEKDLLIFSDKNGHLQIPLALLRRSSPPPRYKFSPHIMPSSPEQDLAHFTPPYGKPLATIPERRLAFISRIFADFAYQWRHIIRSPYAEITFRRLAKAVINIATCDFRIEELFTNMHISPNYRGYTHVLDMPSWDHYEHRIFLLGPTMVVLDLDIQTALQIAKDEIKQSKMMDDRAPGQFLDGLTPPSPSAINLLLEATPPPRPPPRTPIHMLPLELQDRILEHVSEGPVEAARLGCVLDLGSPFTWMRAIDWPRRGGRIELSRSPSHRSDSSPVESKIYFGEVHSGVAYR